MTATALLREVLLIAFAVLAVLYVLRLAGYLKSAHRDKFTDVAHLVMVLAMFGMVMWPNVFMN